VTGLKQGAEGETNDEGIVARAVLLKAKPPRAEGKEGVWWDGSP
jgi:hypothetical protein